MNWGKISRTIKSVKCHCKMYNKNTQELEMKEVVLVTSVDELDGILNILTKKFSDSKDYAFLELSEFSVVTAKYSMPLDKFIELADKTEN